MTSRFWMNLRYISLCANMLWALAGMGYSDWDGLWLRYLTSRKRATSWSGVGREHNEPAYKLCTHNVHYPTLSTVCIFCMYTWCYMQTLLNSTCSTYMYMLACTIIILDMTFCAEQDNPIIIARGVHSLSHCQTCGSKLTVMCLVAVSLSNRGFSRFVWEISSTLLVQLEYTPSSKLHRRGIVEEDW